MKLSVICFEGLPNTGKTTILNNLKHELEGKGNLVYTIETFKNKRNNLNETLLFQYRQTSELSEESDEMIKRLLQVRNSIITIQDGLIRAMELDKGLSKMTPYQTNNRSALISRLSTNTGNKSDEEKNEIKRERFAAKYRYINQCLSVSHRVIYHMREYLNTCIDAIWDLNKDSDKHVYLLVDRYIPSNLVFMPLDLNTMASTIVSSYPPDNDRGHGIYKGLNKQCREKLLEERKRLGEDISNYVALDFKRAFDTARPTSFQYVQIHANQAVIRSRNGLSELGTDAYFDGEALSRHVEYFDRYSRFLNTINDIGLHYRLTKRTLLLENNTALIETMNKLRQFIQLED